MAGQDATMRWEQLSFEPPPVLHVTLQVGIMSAEDHVQAQIEVRDATSNVLLALCSWPHFGLADTEERMREVGRELTRVIRDATGPF